MRRSTLLLLLFILLLAAGAAYVDAPNNGGIHLGAYNNDLQVREGLDLQGGVQVLLEASCSLPPNQCNAETKKLMPDVRDNIERRVNGGLGVSEPVIRLQGDYRISVELPGLKNEQDAVALLGQTGKLEIIDTGPNRLTEGTVVKEGQYPVVFTGDQLDPNSINANIDSQTGKPQILFQFKGSAQSAFANYTQSHVQQYLTITLDGKVIESAVIQTQITGQGQISGGNMTLDQAQATAALLRYGSLPVPLTLVSERLIGATLGQQSVNDSLVAGAIGLGIVILFMLIYYRLPGLLADIALILYAGFTFAVFKMLAVVMTLAGYAGFILSIGMAVDANVLIFERVKEELRGGRTLSQAIDVGFKRAWPSIRDSNASTLITCGILYWFGSNFGASIIVGFATTLFLGVVISLFTAITVTRTFLNLLVPTGVATHPALFGLPRGAITVGSTRRASLERRLAQRGAARARVVEEVEEEEEEEEEEPAGRQLSLKERLALRRAGGGKAAADTAQDEAEDEEEDAEEDEAEEEADAAAEEEDAADEEAEEADITADAEEDLPEKVGSGTNGAARSKAQGNKEETARAGRAGSKRGVED
ncbi:MAG TPA: protein translocase subunit SecD [Ktedonobacterales bacterium]|jgi:preprotein translocase subunit SecD